MTMKMLNHATRHRWPSAEAFYSERDHRTQLQVRDLHSYCHRAIEIHIDHDAAEDTTIQRIAILASNLTARWARNVHVFVPDVALAEPLNILGDGTLSERIAREMRDADPFGNFQLSIAGSRPARDCLRLWVGPRQPKEASEADYIVDASGWSAIGQRVSQSTNWVRTLATAPAAALAAAIGVCDLFKRAVGHPPQQWLQGINWCTWDSTFSHDVTILNQAPSVPEHLDIGDILIAGVGAVGSALLYILGLMSVRGRVTVLDLDSVETSNLNRSPLFCADDALLRLKKTEVARRLLSLMGLDSEVLNGSWAEYSESLSKLRFDAWVSLTNERSAWAEVPFQLPPVVLHGTTTSGWGATFGRHIPRIEDCTACRLPRPRAKFRGPCAEAEISAVTELPVRASLPFLSSISAALIAAELLKLDAPGVAALPNCVSADFLFGLRSIVAVSYPANAKCAGCRMSQLPIWLERGGRSRYARLSAA
jgi:hypothetical protein